MGDLGGHHAIIAPTPSSIPRTQHSTHPERTPPMSPSPARTLPLTSLSDLELHNVRAEVVSHRGKRAVRLSAHFEQESNDQSIAITPDFSFTDGVIEAEV